MGATGRDELMTQPPSPPAGFYEDPADPAKERWWNGQEWTDAIRTREALPPPPYGQYPAGVQPQQYATTSPFGQPGSPVDLDRAPRTGYYTAAWITLIFCAPLTIILNLMDNSQCKARGLPPKYGPTITAIILWAASTLVLMLLDSGSTTGTVY